MRDNKFYLKLFASEKFAKHIWEKHPGLIVFISPDEKLKFFNQNFLNLTGYTYDEIIDKNFFELFIDEKENIKEYFYNIIKGIEDNPHFKINHIRSKKGDRFLIMWTNFYVRDENDDIVGILSFGYDITFRVDYIEDIKKINQVVVNFSQDVNENIRKVVDLAREISGAKFVMLNRIENDMVYVEYCSGIKDYPLNFPLNETLCEKVLKSNSYCYETSISYDIKNDFLLKNGIIKYFSILVDFINKYATLCFFYDNDIYIKRNRIFLIASLLASIYRNKIFINEIILEKDKFLKLISLLPIGVVYADRKTREIIFVNEALSNIIQYPIDLIKNKNLDFLKDMIVDKKLIEDFVENPTKYPDGVKVEGIDVNGNRKIINYRYGFTGEKDKILLLLMDVTSEHKNLEKITRFSEIDSILLRYSSSNLLYYKILDFLLKNFLCEFGFISSIDERNGKMLIRYIISNKDKSDEISFKIGDTINIEDQNLEKILIDSIKNKKINFTNSSINILNFTTKNAILLPLIFNKKIFSLIILANRKDDFNDYVINDISELISYISVRLYYIQQNESLLKDQIEKKMKEVFDNSIIRMTGGIAHDINNLLVPLFTNFSILKEKIENSNFDLDVCELLNESNKYLNLISDVSNELLSISNPKIGILQVIPLDEILKIISFIAKGYFLNLKFIISQDISNLKIKMNKSQLAQLIVNILKNAVESMSSLKRNNVEVELKREIDNKLEFLKISIRDFGVGIKEEDKDKIFEYYYTTKPYGSGLGLFMCKRIIDNIGGRISFESKVNEGSVFHIMIPVYGEELKKDNNEIKFNINNYDLKILVVDDEDYIIKSLKRLFAYFRIEKVDGASNINEVIEKIKGCRFDIVIVDLILKDERGDYVNQKIKEFYPDIFSVVSSGYADNDVIDSFRSYNFDYRLPKPYRLNDIKDLIEYYFKWKKRKEYYS